MQEETRRPRAGLHPIAWLFIVFAAGDVVWYIVNARFDPNPALTDVLAYGLQVVPSVAAVLLPAALLARHPDATWLARTLLFGTIVLAACQGLQILSGPLDSFFRTLTPPSQDLPGLVPSAEIYDGTVSLMVAFGLTYVAVGLSQVRRYEDRSGPLTALFAPLMMVFGTVAGVLFVSGLDLGGLSVSLSLAVYLGSLVVLPVVRIAAWAYLTTSASRGWRAWEDPISGWILAFLGGGGVIVALVLVNLGGLFDPPDATFNIVYRYITLIAYALGHLCLLAGFLVGLPSLDDDDEIDDEVVDDDEFDDDYDAAISDADL